MYRGKHNTSHRAPIMDVPEPPMPPQLAQEPEVFTRRQRAWMGLIVLAAVLVFANWGHSRVFAGSLMQELSRAFFSYGDRHTGVWILNGGLVAAGWLLRAQVGSVFAVILGTLFALLGAIFRRV